MYTCIGIPMNCKAFNDPFRYNIYYVGICIMYSQRICICMYVSMMYVYLYIYIYIYVYYVCVQEKKNRFGSDAYTKTKNKPEKKQIQFPNENILLYTY